MTDTAASDFTGLALRAVEEIGLALRTIQEEDVERLLKLCADHQRIFLVGVGREGLVTRAFAMRLMHLGKTVHWVWDDTTPSLAAGDLLICTSGDGGIGHLDYVCRRARSAGAYVHLVTGSRLGVTAREVAASVTFLPAQVYRGADEVVASRQLMGSLFEQTALIFFDCVVQMLVEGLTESDLALVVERHRNVE